MVALWIEVVEPLDLGRFLELAMANASKVGNQQCGLARASEKQCFGDERSAKRVVGGRGAYHGRSPSGLFSFGKPNQNRGTSSHCGTQPVERKSYLRGGLK